MIPKANLAKRLVLATKNEIVVADPAKRVTSKLQLLRHLSHNVGLRAKLKAQVLHAVAGEHKELLVDASCVVFMSQPMPKQEHRGLHEEQIICRLSFDAQNAGLAMLLLDTSMRSGLQFARRHRQPDAHDKLMSE